MFYGYYTNTIIKTCEAAHLNCSSAAESPITESQTMAYSISTAYFFTTTITFFIICIILVSRLDDE